MKKKEMWLMLAIGLAVLVTITSGVHAATARDWYGTAQAGGDGTNWFTANNWTGNIYPATLDNYTRCWDKPNNNQVQNIYLDTPGVTMGGFYDISTKYDYNFTGYPITIGAYANGACIYLGSSTATLGRRFLTVGNNIIKDTSLTEISVGFSNDNYSLTLSGNLNAITSAVSANTCGLAVSGANMPNTVVTLSGNNTLNYCRNWRVGGGEMILASSAAAGSVSLTSAKNATLSIKANIVVGTFGYGQSSASAATDVTYVRSRGSDGPYTITFDNTTYKTLGNTVVVQPNPDNSNGDNITFRIQGTINHLLNWNTLAGTTISLGSANSGYVTYGNGTNGVISGAGRVVVNSDNATVQINAPDNYTGGTFITKGVLQMYSSNVLPSGGDLYVGSGGSLLMYRSGNAYSQTIGNLTGGDGSLPGIINLGSLGMLTINGGVSPGGTAGTLGTLADNATSAIGDVFLAASSNSVFDVQQPVLAQDNFSLTPDDNLTINSGARLTVNCLPNPVAGTFTLIKARKIFGDFGSDNVSFTNLPTGWTGSYNIDNVTNSVKVTLTSNQPLAATPVLTPAPGTYSTTQSVTITCSTPGAVIHYTTDNSTPTMSSPVFDNTTAPIVVSSAMTIYAKAFVGSNGYSGGYDPSATGGGTYTIATATPVITPGNGVFVGSSNLPAPITISCATPGATIWYTTDNATIPTQGGPNCVQYDGTPITFFYWDTTTIIVKAIAYSNLAPSAVAAGTYVEFDNYDNATTILPGKATVDGNLAEWDTAAFVPLATQYGTNPPVSFTASYAAKWDPATGKVYVAVKVNDSNFDNLTDNVTTGTHDAVEIYIHAPGSTGPLDYRTYQDSAQQYVLGIRPDRASVWVGMGPAGVVPTAGVITAGGKADATSQYYEAVITPYDYFGGISGLISLPSVLHAGDTLGVDVVAVDGYPGPTGYISANNKTGKYVNWIEIGVHQLGTQSFTAADLAALLAAMDCRSTDAGYAAKYDFDGDYQITSSDLAYLLANMP